MQRVERQPGFILHERPYRETSVLLEVLTRDHGRVGLVARGVRSARPRFGRGLLRPLQALSLSWIGRGELGTLTDADPVGTPFPLSDESLVCALYLNELLLRLLPRSDPQQALITRYATCLGELAGARGEAQAWTLRRFERDLLEQLGYGLVLDVDADGVALRPDIGYRYDPETGAHRVGADLPFQTRGASLLALAADEQPGAATLRDLRRLMRAVLRHHLGGRDLVAWRMVLPSAGAATRSGIGAAADDDGDDDPEDAGER